MLIYPVYADLFLERICNLIKMTLHMLYLLVIECELLHIIETYIIQAMEFNSFIDKLRLYIFK